MRFNDDMICRNDLPLDAFQLIHDLCYDHEGRDRKGYKVRAQKILKADCDITKQGRHKHYKCKGCDFRVAEKGMYCGECMVEDDSGL